MKTNVPELVVTSEGIQRQPEKVIEMIRLDVREIVGEYLTSPMTAKLGCFLGRQSYGRGQGEMNHRNGGYERHFTLKEASANVG